MSTTNVVATQDPCRIALPYTLDMATIGERVAQRRNELDWSQARLALEVTKAGVKITQGGIDKIEKRPSPTSRPRCLPELALALGVSQAWLITGKDAPANQTGTTTINPDNQAHKTTFTREQWMRFRDSCQQQFESAGLDIDPEKRDKLFDLMWWAFEQGASQEDLEKQRAAEVDENN